MVVKVVLKRKNEDIQIWSRYSVFKNTGCRLPASSFAALSAVDQITGAWNKGPEQTKKWLAYMQIYYTYAFCSTLFQTSVDQITPINDQNSINNNLSADRKYISISELEFFDCGAANIAYTDRFTPKQIVYHARTQVPPPKKTTTKKPTNFSSKNRWFWGPTIKLNFLKQKAWTLQSCQDFVINNLTFAFHDPGPIPRVKSIFR